MAEYFAVVRYNNVSSCCAYDATISSAVFLHGTQAKFAQMSANKIPLVR